LKCPGCGEASDAWVNPDGTLENPKDAECRRNPNLPCFRQGMVPEED